MTNAELIDEIACQIIDDVCDFHKKYVGNDSLAAELARVASEQVEGTLLCCEMVQRYGTPKQQRAVAGWAAEVKASIYTRLGVRMT